MNAAMNIRAKIGVTLGVCAALIALLGALGGHGMAVLSRDMQSMYAQDTASVSGLSTVESSALRIRLGLMRMPAMRNPADVQAMMQRLTKTQHALADAWRDYYPARVSQDEERALAQQCDAAIAAFGPQTDATMAALQHGSAADWNPALASLADRSQVIYDNADRIAALKTAHARDTAAAGAARFRRLLVLFAAAAVASLVAAYIAGVYLVRAISRPLDVSVEIADRIANGWLDNPIAMPEGSNEFGRLLRSLGHMDAQLAHVVRGIQTASETILTATDEIAAGNRDLSMRTEEQAASLEQTAASVAQFTANNHTSIERVRETMELASDAARVARDGDAGAARMVATMRDISGQSVQIADITTLIEGIAAQTNILALNAAVEAARAGELGRGFAVVAGEMRGLAQHASAAAKQIRDLIHRSLDSVKSGAGQAEYVGTLMTDISRAIDRVAAINAALFTTAKEQATGLGEVNIAIGKLDEVAQHNAALVEEATAATQSLVDQVGHQREMLMAFRFTETPDAQFMSAE